MSFIPLSSHQYCKGHVFGHHSSRFPFHLSLIILPGSTDSSGRASPQSGSLLARTATACRGVPMDYEWWSHCATVL